MAARQRLVRTCERCAAVFEAWPSYVARGGGRFCTVACRRAARNTRAERTCAQCGVAFSAKAYRVKAGEANYCSQSCFARSWPRERIDGGRVYLYMPTSPMALCNGYVARARVVMARKLGRDLRGDEVVHHIDHDPMNDAPDNLLLTSAAEHRRIHNLEGAATEAATARWGGVRA